jgi:hypothetical protein
MRDMQEGCTMQSKEIQKNHRNNDTIAFIKEKQTQKERA